MSRRALVAPPRRDPGRRAAPLQPGARRGRVPAGPRDRRVLRFHQARPVQTRLPPERGVRRRSVNIHPKSPVRIAGVDVGKVTSIQREGNAGAGDDGNRNARAADPHRRDAEDPAAHLPGRQLVRRHCSPAAHPRQTVSSGYTIPITQTADPGAARPGARRAQHRHARQPAELPAGLRRRADAQARRRRKRRPGPRRVRAERRAGAEQDLPPRALRAARLGDRQPGARRHRTARSLRADHGDRQSHGAR